MVRPTRIFIHVHMSPYVYQGNTYAEIYLHVCNVQEYNSVQVTQII